jgi:hypothetical protein
MIISVSSQAITPAPQLTPAQSRSVRENIAYQTYMDRIDAAFSRWRAAVAADWQICAAEYAAAERDFVAGLAQLLPAAAADLPGGDPS